MLDIASVTFGVGVFVALIYVVIASIIEEEKHAARRALVLALILPLPYVLAGVLDFPYDTYVAGALLCMTGLAVVIVAVPVGVVSPAGDDTPRGRIDERDVMFSRCLLSPGTERFDAYYRDNPNKKPLDDMFRSKAGLLKKGTTFYHPVTFSAANASFTAVSAFRPLVDGDPAPEKNVLDPAEITGFIKRWARQIGAVSVGVTELEDYHLYSVVGRGDQYGEPVALDHRFAIAITVEMTKKMIDRAPYGPIVMESAQQYLRSGAMAVQIAGFIRNLGYPARAHIDGNYRVVCPLVARDAGLGEIGRMGLLMTPELGPRVRIAVVTTDLPLIPDRRHRDPAVIEFCRHCKKCAEACPSRAISFDERSDIDGARRWQINQEKCYTYWSSVGTDCGRCVKVCPYSHPDNMMHNLVRRGIRRSSLFRRMAVALDDFFYGAVPPPLDPPEWMDVEK